MAETETPRGWRRWFRPVFVVAVVLAVVLLLWQQRHEVGRSLRDLSPESVVLSLVFAVVGVWLPGVVWRDLLTSQGHRIGVLPGWRAFFIAQLGKYLPGGVWTLVAQVAMARDLKVPAREAAAASFLGLALSIISSLLLAGVTLPVALPDLVSTYWWVFAVVPALLVLLHPRVVTWWSGTAFRLLRRPGAGLQLSWKVLLRSTALLLLSWVALGLHFGILVAQLEGNQEGASRWTLSLGVFALAWVAGFLVIVAPAGAGVREAALVLGFASILPAAAVLAIAVLSRVLLVAADVLLAGGVALAARLAPAAGPPTPDATG
ncbi:lysylphosphatidylglycerol synthase domain-containing protein [uncultured Modestobacter sp.]|uniref:lysylphosphatidylglycerol synthase domain-containing protein n=1 Tax=uncultured Modestobacter sp. TaxID=380048 RepID=UPI00262958BE|nr:lysylphosphatidylglycerol synthase domain-containing protein [uncultured Modestobacter sp.]